MHFSRGGEWYLEKRGSRKIFAGSRNLGSVFDKSRSLVFAWFVFTFFESRNFLTKSLGLGFLTRISVSRRVSDFTIRYPFQCVHWNRLSRVCVQVDHTISPRPHVSIFFWKCESFFFGRFSKFIRSHVAFLILWNHRFQKVPFWRVHTKTRKQCFQREIIASGKFHFFITLRYFDQSYLSLVTISNSLHSFTDGSSSKVVTGWRKFRDSQSRNWKID